MSISEENQGNEHMVSSIWSWGAGTSGQLGDGSFDDHLLPQKLSYFCGKIIHQVSCGGSHSIALLENGTVESWGCNAFGQLGHLVHQFKTVSLPSRIKAFHEIKIVQVSAGWSHSGFITEFGNLYMCGEGEYGQLGLQNFENKSIPEMVAFFEQGKVKNIACGLRHTLILTNENRILSCGFGKKGQLGFLCENKIFKNCCPHEISFLDNSKKIIQILANGDQSSLITEDGKLYIWGKGYFEKNNLNIFSPIEIGKQNFWKKCSLGWHHGLGIDSNDELWSWGSNRYGQLGLVHTTDEFEEEIFLENLLACPEKSSKILKFFKVKFPETQKISSFSCGAEHSIAALESGEVFSWGWAEHGQLGLGDTVDKDFPQKVKLDQRQTEEKIFSQKIKLDQSQTEEIGVSLSPIVVAGSGFTIAYFNAK